MRIQQETALPGEDGEQPEFRVIVEGEPRPLHPVLRDEVYRIGREALLNAFRHSRAKKIEVEVLNRDRIANLLEVEAGSGSRPLVAAAREKVHGQADFSFGSPSNANLAQSLHKKAIDPNGASAPA